MTALAGIRNFIPMTDCVATSGQPKREQFALIAAARYGAVINLAMPESDGAIPDEAALVSALGMRYVHIPVPFGNPTTAHLKTFIDAMRGFEGECVWVHCVANMRVSAFMYHYLRFEKGYDAASAKNALLKEWEPKMDAAWTRFIALTPADVA